MDCLRADARTMPAHEQSPAHTSEPTCALFFQQQQESAALFRGEQKFEHPSVAATIMGEKSTCPPPVPSPPSRLLRLRQRHCLRRRRCGCRSRIQHSDGLSFSHCLAFSRPPPSFALFDLFPPDTAQVGRSAPEGFSLNTQPRVFCDDLQVGDVCLPRRAHRAGAKARPARP